MEETNPEDPFSIYPWATSTLNGEEKGDPAIRETGSTSLDLPIPFGAGASPCSLLGRRFSI